MTTLDTVLLIVGSIVILGLSVDLMVSDKGRAFTGFVLAMNVNMVVDILVRNLK